MCIIGCVHPGGIKTNIAANGKPIEVYDLATKTKDAAGKRVC